MWKCKHCKQDFAFETTQQKASHARWCKCNPTCLIGAETYRKNTQLKLRSDFECENVECHICKNSLTFSRWKKQRHAVQAGKQDFFCGSAKCRSTVNRQNSLKQDKSQISSQVRLSNKWKIRQQKFLEKKKSGAEQSVFNALCALYPTCKVESTKCIHFNDSVKFVDIVINDKILIEVDGYWHSTVDGLTRDAKFDSWVKSQGMIILRYNVHATKRKQSPELHFANFIVKINLTLNELGVRDC